VHLYNATSPLFRDLVFRMSRDEIKALAVDGTHSLLKHAQRALPGCDLGFQYSPELFNETEPEFALEVCEAVMDVWQPGPGREIVLNFPTTVERTLPNVFADQIELLDRSLSRREHVCLSVHPHNDRGTAVATAELAVLAGAQRIEGCLFGGGERAGNVCLVTLGLNLLTHGVDPGIDFSDLDHIRRTVEACTGLEVGERHPYAGDLVFTAFSGSHQDAINKGFEALRQEVERTGADARDLPWQIPYLPLDPGDLGRDYDAVVRVNSQSGKSGVAYVMSTRHGMQLPRGLQIEFARSVQALAEATGTEVGPAQIKELFQQEYVAPGTRPEALRTSRDPVSVTLYIAGIDDAGHAEAVQMLEPWGIEVHRQSAAGLAPAPDQGHDATVTVYAACSFAGEVSWGAGLGATAQAAALRAVRAAIVRAGAAEIPQTRSTSATRSRARRSAADYRTLGTPVKRSGGRRWS